MTADSFGGARGQVSARLAIGLAQGAALFLLQRAAVDRIWPATDGLIFAPALLLASFVPFIGLFGWGNVSRRNLLTWTLAAALLLAGLAVHDIMRDPGARHWSHLLGYGDSERNIFPGPLLFFFSAAGLFIGHALVTAGDAERRYIAAFPSYFDIAWKLGVQLAFSAAFLAAFWAVLVLGAALFQLIDLDFLYRLIEKRWFSIPATTSALAIAIHITDVRPGIVRGIRALALTLLSWLLPLMAIIAAGFLLSLPFTGLVSLWNTRLGTPILLGVAAALILLINATYQGGPPEHVAPRLLRYAGGLGAVLLLPLTALTAYGLGLRVAQHGWTSDRIIAAACIVIVGWHALGYASAVVTTGPWLRRLEITNITGAWVILTTLLALFTPVADPARLSVASQLARLESGRVALRDFDFQYLRFEGGRYGREALDRLKAEASGEDADYIRREINAVLALQNPRPRGAPQPTPDMIAGNITMHPADRSLPDSFLSHSWQHQHARPLECLRQQGAKCDGFFVDLDGDGKDEIVLLSSQGESAVPVAFGLKDDGWFVVGHLSGGAIRCRDDLLALRSGRVGTVVSQWRDVEVNGKRYRLDVRLGTPGSCR